MKKKKRENVFCRVQFLNGEKRIYQFPNDLREAMLQSYKDDELKGILKGALINVPTSAYKNNHADLHLAKILHIFVEEKERRWRTRGQFLTKDSWTNKLSFSQVKFLLHDHNFKNKCRILLDLFKWRHRDESNYLGALLWHKNRQVR